MIKATLNTPSGLSVNIVLPATNEYAVKPEIYKDIYVNGLLDPIRLTQKILSDAKRDLSRQDIRLCQKNQKLIHLILEDFQKLN